MEEGETKIVIFRSTLRCWIAGGRDEKTEKVAKRSEQKGREEHVPRQGATCYRTRTLAESHHSWPRREGVCTLEASCSGGA